MPQTGYAAVPPTDQLMWRRLLKRCHPDAGGTHELFVWAMSLRERVEGASVEAPFGDAPPPRGEDAPPSEAEPPKEGRKDDAKDRIDFSRFHTHIRDFEQLNLHALAVAEEVDEVYARLLRMLGDCAVIRSEVNTGSGFKMQGQGATYKSLAAIAHKAGMTKPQRLGWYRVAESVPLSQRHVSHIMKHLQDKTP
jgi:hypothetical protein